MFPNDPTLMKDLGDAHLAELRAAAASHRMAPPSSLPAWRSIAGRAMLRAALRLLGEPGSVPVAETGRGADNA